MIVKKFTQRIFYLHIQIRFKGNRYMAEIGHQHVEVPLAATISPLAISPSTWVNEMRPDHNNGSSMPYPLRVVRGFFSLSEKTWKSNYLRGVIRKVSTFSSICGCSNSRPLAWQPNAQPTELIHRWQVYISGPIKQKASVTFETPVVWSFVIYQSI